MTPEQIADFKVDKSDWGDGPWQQEPDRVDWHHAGLPCLMVRGPLTGSWCGYVGVPPSHPCYGKGYNDLDVEVHGGLTYAAACDGERICHVPAPGESDETFWFGFDTGHSWDVSPAMDARIRSYGLPPSSGLIDGTTYKDVAYVRAETEKLADQLAALVKDGDRREQPENPLDH